MAPDRSESRSSNRAILSSSLIAADAFNARSVLSRLNWVCMAVMDASIFASFVDVTAAHQTPPNTCTMSAATMPMSQDFSTKTVTRPWSCAAVSSGVIGGTRTKTGGTCRDDDEVAGYSDGDARAE